MLAGRGGENKVYRREESDLLEPVFVVESRDQRTAGDQQYRQQRPNTHRQPKQGADFFLGNLGLLNRCVTSAEVDQDRRKASDGRYHGHQPDVLRREQPGDPDLRAHLHDDIRGTGRHGHDSATKGFAAMSFLNSIIVEKFFH